MVNKRHSSDEVIEAIKGSYGIKSTIARKLKVHRHTVDNYLRDYATAQKAYDDEVERIGDLAESNIIAAIENKDIDTSKWYARMKLQRRGYVERQEVTGADSGPLNVVFKYVDSDADKTDEQ